MQPITKAQLINKFKTGDVPTGQDFKNFIEAFIGTINGNSPDAMGNVDVPVNFSIMNELQASTLPNVYDQGTTVSVQQYVKGNDPNGWHTILPTDVESGEIFIQTIRFPEQNVTIQQIDTSRDGLYSTNVSRVSTVEGGWGTVNLHPFIRSVNGIPVPYSGDVIVPKPKITNHRIFRSVPANTYPIFVDIPNIQDDNCVVNFFSDGSIAWNARLDFRIHNDTNQLEIYKLDENSYGALSNLTIFVSVFE